MIKKTPVTVTLDDESIVFDQQNKALRFKDGILENNSEFDYLSAEEMKSDLFKCLPQNPPGANANQPYWDSDAQGIKIQLDYSIGKLQGETVAKILVQHLQERVNETNQIAEDKLIEAGAQYIK